MASKSSSGSRPSPGSTRHEVQERARPLDVLEEADAEARAVGRARDEAGDVGDHERLLSESTATTPRCGTSVVNG